MFLNFECGYLGEFFEKMGFGDWFFELIVEMVEMGVGVINGMRCGIVFGILFFIFCFEVVVLFEGVMV